MSLQIKIKTVGCYLLFVLMLLSASFKLFHYGPSVHFYVYPLPDLMLNVVPYLELLGGILFLIGTRKISFRIYGGLVLIPLLIGAVSSHIAFGWLNLLDGKSEPAYFTVPSFIILCLTIWVSYKPILGYVREKFNPA